MPKKEAAPPEKPITGSGRSTEGAPPRSSLVKFQVLSRLIAPQGPEWLPQHLERWSSTIFLNFAVEQRQPTRAAMKRILERCAESAKILQSALAAASVREFLDGGGVEAAVTKSSTGAAAICGCGGVKSSQW